MLEQLGLTGEVVPVERSVDTALAKLAPAAQAVYVGPLPHLLPGEFDRLVQGLIDRRLPSFSFVGKSQIERGLLVTLYPDTDRQALARQVALNLQQILLGEDAGAFPITFSRGERLTINLATARAIGLSPPWNILTEAELLHEERPAVPQVLSLSDAAREAVTANLELRAAERGVAAGFQNIREALARLFPQIGASTEGSIIDRDRAKAAPGALPEQLFLGSLTLNQLLFSEPTWANVTIQRRLQEAREEDFNTTKLDIILLTTVSYLDVLRSKTIARIQRDNLDETRSNLELARIRQAIGQAGPEEVFRWENQIANDRSRVVNSNVRQRQAEITLNQILHRSLEELFQTKEPDLDDPEFLTSFSTLFPYLDNPQRFSIFRDFMVQEGLRTAPELRSADARIAAQERTLLSTERAFYAPEVSALAEVSGVVQGGEGDQFLVNDPDNLEWIVGFQASLPLYTGGGRRAARDRAREELHQVQLERQALEERIARDIRVALYAAGDSFIRIRLAREAAEAARKNFDLVTERYARGVADIIQLLDAQNAALVADQEAANAVFTHLIELMNVQRVVGQFDFFMSLAERQAWLERLNTFFHEAGVSPGKR
jgi:outer membrane protein TolC